MAKVYLLDKGRDKQGFTILSEGKPFYRESESGLIDSVLALQKAGNVQVPPYLLVAGRIHAIAEARQAGDVRTALDQPLWSCWHDSRAEVLTLKDEKGILGTKGDMYVVDLVNSGLFLHKPGIFKREQENGKKNIYVNPRIKNFLLDAIARRDMDVLRQKGWVGNDENVYVFKNFGEFDDESSADVSFTQNNPSYVVLRKAEDAIKWSYHYQGISEVLENQDFLIRSGGRFLAKAVLFDKTGRQHFGWSEFGSFHEGYKYIDSLRVVALNKSNSGFDLVSILNPIGNSVGVCKDAITARTKIVARAQGSP